MHRARTVWARPCGCSFYGGVGWGLFHEIDAILLDLETLETDSIKTKSPRHIITYQNKRRKNTLQLEVSETGYWWMTMNRLQDSRLMIYYIGMIPYGRTSGERCTTREQSMEQMPIWALIPAEFWLEAPPDAEMLDSPQLDYARRKVHYAIPYRAPHLSTLPSQVVSAFLVRE